MDSFSETDKAALRRAKIAARNALTGAERREKSEAVVRRLLALPAFREAETVMVYRAVGGEVRLDTLPGLAPGKRFVYPRCLPGRQMQALMPADETAWRPGPFRIPEPDPARSEEVPPEDIDLVVCPCTAFDDAGNRLGMGGGYYDRFLPLCAKAFAVAVAFEVQRADRVPTDSRDRRMDLVITEKI